MTDHPLWTPEAVVAATGGAATQTPASVVTGVSIDSRTLEPGDLFVAITGENSDGHDYVEAAFGAGAAAAIVSRDTARLARSGPLIVVDDALTALEALGRAARQRTAASIVAVTGSVGKTGTKEALKLALGATGAVHASLYSYNNQWGVPLSLARMPENTEFGVFEIGMNHPGEIAPLSSMVRPNVAIITTVEPVHLGYFSSTAEIAMAKAEVFTGLAAAGTAILNYDNEHFALLRDAAEKARAGRMISFGSDDDADARLIDVHLGADFSTVSADICGHKMTYRIASPGRHLAINSLAVLAAVDTLGADLALGAMALGGWQPAAGRGRREILDTGAGGVTLIDESYNANPASMAAALETLAQAEIGRGGRRIAVLGDMLELGDRAPGLHRDVRDAVERAGCDLVFACGPLMQHLWQALPESRRGCYAPDAALLADPLCAALRAGDVVMIKGSLGSRLGPLVAAVRSHFMT